MRILTRLTLVILILAAAVMACSTPVRPRLIQGSGNIIEENRPVSGFDRIAMAGAGRIIITQGDRESLTIETDDNLLEYIQTEVKGDTLEIDFTKDLILSSGTRDSLEPSAGFIFRISVIDLEEISVSGAADIQAEKIKAERFEVNFSGAGEITIDDLNTGQLDVNLSGVGDVVLAGMADSQDIVISGLGRYQGFDVESQNASVIISGAGGAELWVTETLDVVISGAGDVEYYGTPTVNPEISGLGRLQGLGEK
jgi:hypothetical protein